jgi:hypothetical protein
MNAVADDIETVISRKIRFEQKSELLTRELICRFSMPQDTVIDLFSGMNTTAGACLKISDGIYRLFVGSKLDESCHNLSSNSLLKAFREQYMKGWFVQPDKEMQRIFRLDRHPKQKELGWTPPAGWSAFYFLSEHILHFLEILRGDSRLADTMRNRSTSGPWNTWRGWKKYAQRFCAP